MQITMRNVSDRGTIDRVFSPYEDTYFRDYLRDRYERTTDYLEKASTKVAKGFVDRAKRIFESINSDEALRKTRDAIRTAGNVRRAGSIYGIQDISDFRSAGFQMQRFLMADPVIRKKYHRQQIDGYNETYIDNHKNDIGSDHYDYRRVMNGVWREEKDANGEDVMVREVFYEQLVEGDRDLDHPEQHHILDAWDIQRMHIAAGIDTTNRLGGSLG